jgi:hypothetical protein
MNFNPRSEWLSLNESRMINRDHWYVYGSGIVSCCIKGSAAFNFIFDPNDQEVVADSLCQYLYELGIDYKVELIDALGESTKYQIFDISRKVTLEDVLSLRKKGRLTE